MEIKNRIAFVIGVLKLYNPQVNNLNFHYDQELELLRISNNLGLTWGFALQNFPLKILNISFTRISTLRTIRAVEMQELNASHTPLNNLNYLIVDNLRSLDISHTKVSNLRHLENSPIQILNISHNQVKSLGSVKKMKYLRDLTVHQGQFSEADLAQIPKSVDVKVLD